MLYLFYLFIILYPHSIGSETPPRVPKGLKEVTKTSSTITFQWDLNNNTETNGVTDGYTTEIQCSLGTCEPRIQTTTSNICVFKDLDPCTNYCFDVLAFNSKGKSEKSNSLCSTTKADFSEIISLSIKSEMSTSRLISWNFTQNSCDTFFRVRYSLIGSNSSIDNVTKHFSFNLTNLEIDSEYEVKVRPETKEEIGDFSMSKLFFTKNVTQELQKLALEFELNVYDTSLIADSSHSTENVLFLLSLKDKKGNYFYFVKYACSISYICLYNFNKSLLHSKDTVVFKEAHLCTNITKGSFNKSEESHFQTIVFVKANNVTKKNLYLINKCDLSEGVLPQRNSSIIYVQIIFGAFLTIGIIVYLYLYGESCFRLDKTSKRAPRLTVLDDSFPSSEVMESAFEEVDVHSTDQSFQIEKEFKSICFESQEFMELNNLTTMIGNLPINKEKNRFNNIVPFDHNRVKISQSNYESNYINASFIPFENNEEDPEYISCQDPLETTIKDFWWMVWEQNVTFIIMLTNILVNTKEKCYKYWPNLLNETMEIGDGLELVLTLTEEWESEVSVERKIKLINKITNEERIIIHLQMKNWNDFSISMIETFDQFMIQFHQLAKLNPFYPFLVHCRNGVGKTGIFIIIDRIIMKIKNGNELINVYDEVLQIRKFRHLMVHHKSQYIFIHEFVKYYITKINQNNIDQLMSLEDNKEDENPYGSIF